MIMFLEGLMVNSSDATELAKFYREVVGLKQTDAFEGEDGGENGYVFSFGDGRPGIYIADHSEVKGKNENGSRMMFNLEVDDFEKEVTRLKKEGVKMIGEPHHVGDYGFVATFEDPDGNYFQFVKTRE